MELKHRKVAVFHYSQTGQGREIMQSLCAPIAEAGHNLLFLEIRPEEPFPFPWTSDAFFDAFPESRLLVGCKVNIPGMEDAMDADLAIIVYPAWFLSPAIPVQGFFLNAEVRSFLKGRKVVTLCACRNMWIKAQEKVQACIASSGGTLVGSIIMQDRHHNLVSALTIVRWLMGGRKEAKGLFPGAGVSPADISNASTFGQAIASALDSGAFSRLQSRLMDLGAILYKANMAFVESAGHRLFGLWAKVIIRTERHSAHRRLLLKAFKYYLYVALFAVSPLGLLVFHITYPFRIKGIRRDRARRCLHLN